MGQILLRSTFLATLLSLSLAIDSLADKVSLKNGDRISGIIASMDSKKLVIKTPYAGEVSIDWGSVDQFATDEPLVLTKGNQQTVAGTVKSVDNDLVVTTSQGEERIAISDVTFLRSLSDQAAYEKSLSPNLLQGWAGGGNFGLALARGNSQSTNLALGFDAKRKTANDALSVNAASIYSSDATLDTTTANSLQGMIRYDRDLSKRMFVYGIFAGGYDRLQDLDYRLMPGGGLGFHAIATDKTILDLLGGFGYTRESYSTGLTRNLASTTIGDEFTYKLSSRTTFTQNLYYLPSLNDTSIYRLIANVGVTTKLVSWMSANLLFNDRHNSQPVLGNKKNDVLFTTGLGFTFGAKPE